MMSEIRYDRLYDAFVVIAPERLHRPDFVPKAALSEPDGPCPFCEGNESMTPGEIYALRSTPPNEKGWKIRVVPNRFKALKIESAYAFHEGAFPHWDGFGAHELIIDTPHHATSMSQWNLEETDRWLSTVQGRFCDLQNDGRFAYIAVFKNEGLNAGATQPHCHTQLIGLPILPNAERSRCRNERDHWNQTGTSLLESLISDEIAYGERIVMSESNALAYCPYASMHPFEVIVAVTVDESFATLSDTTRIQIASLLHQVVVGLKEKVGVADFNLSFVSPDMHDVAHRQHNRFAIRVLPRVYRYGGFEAGSGTMINPMPPERAAKILRGEGDG